MFTSFIFLISSLTYANPLPSEDLAIEATRAVRTAGCKSASWETHQGGYRVTCEDYGYEGKRIDTRLRPTNLESVTTWMR